ncbi:MAG TPA: IS21 family transposase [Acidimicrobiales bacterium]|nr:IS21 family transposase [Acidimicrobiales bacterium]
MKSAREKMNYVAAYYDVGSFRGAAAVCGTTPKTVKRAVARHLAGDTAPERTVRPSNTDCVADLVAKRVGATRGRISAKRLLPEARAAGYAGSARNFRRVVAEAKRAWRRDNAAGRRPGVWSPGETLIIDWGVEDGTHIFCAVAAWSRFRFVRFATDERAETTLRLLVECFEVLGGVPKVVLADRMGCLKAGVVANVVIPTPAYVRFATHYGFRPDFCEAADPESKGMVEHLVGYSKRDLVVPATDPDNAGAAAWCDEVNAAVHSETMAVPACRLEVERRLFAPLPSLRPSLAKMVTRKVDRLSTVRFGSGRYSVPKALVGKTVEVQTEAGVVRILHLGAVMATHHLVAPGETSIVDEHYGGPRPRPRRAVRPRTPAEIAVVGLGEVGEAFIKGAAGAGVTKLPTELAEIVALELAWGRDALIAALERAVAFGRWRAADVASILAAGAGTPRRVRPGEALIVDLPAVPIRALAHYAPEELG